MADVPGWTPSTARTVSVAAPAPLRGVRVAQLPLTWPGKAPAADLDFALDLTAWMADASDSLATITAPVVSTTGSPQDLGVVWAVVAGQQVVLLLSGGVAGQAYTVSIPVRTACGRACTWVVQLQVDTSTASTTATPPALPPSVSVGPEGAITMTPAAWPVADPGVPGQTYVAGGWVFSSAGNALPADFSFANLPPSDPAIAGRLWSSGGKVVISAGPLPAQTAQDVYFAALPTTDPLVLNAPWSSGGYLTISAGAPTSP